MNNDGHSFTTCALTISDRLGLEVCTLSGESSVKVGQANVQVKAVDNLEDCTLTIENVKVRDNLTITTRAKDLSHWPHMKGLKIPIVDDNHVTMRIGSNVPEAQVHEECRRGRSGEPYAVRTVLGWAVLGPVNVANSSSSQVVNVNFVKYGDELSDQQMRQFLRLDDIGMNRSSKKAMSVEDQEALKRTESQCEYYTVIIKLACCQKVSPLGCQTTSKWQKLQRDEMFHRKYREFMENLIERGYARKLTEKEAA